jgi:hypothetical protein
VSFGKTPIAQMGLLRDERIPDILYDIVLPS